MNITDLTVIEQVNPVISFNFDEASKYLDDKLQDMKGWIITERTLDGAKKDLADLNKLKANIEAFRKEKKKVMEAPIKEFESKCKMLVAKVDEVYLPIKEQTDAFEEKRREQKREEILELISEQKAKSILPQQYLERLVFDEKWLNKTVSIKQVEDQILEQLAALAKEYEAEKQKQELISTYCELANEKYGLDVKLDPQNYFYLDLAAAKQKIDEAGQRAKEQQEAAIRRIKEEAERKAQVESEQRARELAAAEVAKAQQEKAEAQELMNQVVSQVESFTPVYAEEEKTELYHFSVRLTKSELKAVQNYLKAQNFEYSVYKGV